MDKIDFVISWVNNNDPVWQDEKHKYQCQSQNYAMNDAREMRYRDWDNLRYWFRGVEKFAPWVHEIFFVTWGHIPSWLNTEHPKLKVVNHQEYIPTQYLPTFSSRTIELNLHRIQGLSEQFVYFNDDMFIISKAEPEDFFCKGLPCDAAVLDALSLNGVDMNGTPLNPEEIYAAYFFSTIPINRHFKKKDVIKQNFWKWFSPKYGIQMARTLLLMPWNLFTGFKGYHLPYSMLKTTYREVWEKEQFLLDVASMHKFRNPIKFQEAKHALNKTFAEIWPECCSFEI